MEDEIAARVERAKASVRELAEQFPSFVAADINKARVALDTALPKPLDCAAEMADYFDAMHNIKGLGGSFNYQLVTDVADSNCRLLKEGGDSGEDVLKLCQAHLNTLTSIVDRRIQGSGGDTGAQIVATLTANVDKVIAEIKA